jgi:hypothetical protein
MVAAWFLSGHLTGWGHSNWWLWVVISSEERARDS